MGGARVLTPRRQSVPKECLETTLGQYVDEAGKAWQLPSKGLLELTVTQQEQKPMLSQSFSDRALLGMLGVVFTATASRRQREGLLALACLDMCVGTIGPCQDS